MFILNSDDNNWTEVNSDDNNETELKYSRDAPLIPKERNAHSMTTIDNRLYLFGGYNSKSCIDDFWCFNTETLKWSEIQLELNKLSKSVPLRGHTANAIGNKIYIFGGFDNEDQSVISNASNEIYIINVEVHFSVPDASFDKL